MVSSNFCDEAATLGTYPRSIPSLRGLRPGDFLIDDFRKKWPPRVLWTRATSGGNTAPVDRVRCAKIPRPARASPPDTSNRTFHPPPRPFRPRAGSQLLSENMLQTASAVLSIRDVAARAGRSSRNRPRIRTRGRGSAATDSHQGAYRDEPTEPRRASPPATRASLGNDHGKRQKPLWLSSFHHPRPRACNPHAPEPKFAKWPLELFNSSKVHVTRPAREAVSAPRESLRRLTTSACQTAALQIRPRFTTRCHRSASSAPKNPSSPPQKPRKPFAHQFFRGAFGVPASTSPTSHTSLARVISSSTASRHAS